MSCDRIESAANHPINPEGNLMINRVIAISAALSVFSLPNTVRCENTPELTIYTYDSLVSEWGPGPALKKSFESECHCRLKWVSVADGAALLARLRVEGSASKADLVMGIDDTLTVTAEQTGLFADSEITLPPLNLPAGISPSKIFTPFDYGYYSFVIDTAAKQKSGKPYPRPKSFEALLAEPAFNKSIIVQDPRTSAPGLGLLLWLHSLKSNTPEQALGKLKSKILTVSKGWSESYALFTKGEAPIVFSYTTSEAYHRDIDKTDRYQTLEFDDGHYVSVETMALLKSSRNKDLARQFMKFVLRDAPQGLIASGNWMYPVTPITTGLPASYSKLKKPATALRLSPEVVNTRRAEWTRQWTQILGN